MGLDIYFSEDIRNAIQAADEASSSTARAGAAAGRDPVTLRAYLEGYRAALTTVALAFGLPPSILEKPRVSVQTETVREWHVLEDPINSM